MIDVTSILIELKANMENLEKNIDLKLDYVSDKVSNLEDKVSTRIEYLERKMNEQCESQKKKNEITESHERQIKKIDDLQSRYLTLSLDVDSLKKKVDVLEDSPTSKKAKTLDDFLDTFKKVIFTAISTGILGFLTYFAVMYIKGK